MQLFQKLSESLLILEKFRAKEKRDENFQWFGRNIFAFITTSFITAIILIGSGVATPGKKDEKEGER